MKRKMKNNSLIFSGLSFEEVLFDVGTDKCSVQFNGNGGFNSYHLVNEPKYNCTGPSFLDIFVDDSIIDINVKKTVICIGRTQKIIYKFNDGKITVDQFAYEEYIFNKITYRFNEEKKIALSYDFLRFVNMPLLACNGQYEHNLGNEEYYAVRNGKSGSINVCICFSQDPKKMVGKTNSIFKAVKEEYENLPIPSTCDSELLKTIYTSSMFTALENYKDKDEFHAFAAGVHYLSPLRTYFRDSYWTTLCLYAYKPEYVRKQIIALSKGINEDGNCPSAVKSDFTGFWGGHIDSPCFFVMMVADYVKNTKDISILDLVINDKLTIKELCIKVTDKIMTRVDSTHLLYKEGPYNRLDWADAVNRTGYVTYDEALYYQCLICMAFILKDTKCRYFKEAQIVKEQINKLLWDEKKGYYLNFLDGDLREDNLSIDTILTVLFDIVPNNKKETLLNNFENILYSKNHKGLEDFGVMCLYPLYKGHVKTVGLSNQPYRYHNGSNWPYWAGLFAYMLMINNRDYHYALESWFTYSVKIGCNTPLEYITPYNKQGSNLQAWSSTSAFALQHFTKNFFQYNIKEGDFIYEKEN